MLQELLFLGAASLAPTTLTKTSSARLISTQLEATALIQLSQAQPVSSDECQTVVEGLTAVETLLQEEFMPLRPGGTLDDWKVGFDPLKANARECKLGIPDLHFRLYKMINSLGDIHTRFVPDLKGVSALPIAVTGSEGRYFITYIDRSKAPKEDFPFELGDELVTFNGAPTAEVVRKLKEPNYNPNAATNEAFGQLFLTTRTRARLNPLESGQAKLGIRRRSQTTLETAALSWEVNPDIAMLPSGLGHWQKPKFSFLPHLGEPVWETGLEGNQTFHAYITQMRGGRRLGYLRIPTFDSPNPNASAAEFSGIIQHFESETDAMVLDLTHNNGGVAMYLYALLSHLSDRPLKLVPQRFRISKSAEDTEKSLFEFGEGLKSDEDVQARYGKVFYGYPMTLKFVDDLRETAMGFRQARESGLKVSEPIGYHVSSVQPHPETRYTKPMIVLINGLTISSAEIMAATLQDNHRAMLFGSPTAGGPNFPQTFDDIHPKSGLKSITLSSSQPVRANDPGSPVTEVQPDVRFEVAAEEIQAGYPRYREKLLETLESLITQSGH